MTRQTKLYRVKEKDVEILHRTLTVLELTYLKNISNDGYRYEQACRLAVKEGDLSKLHFSVLNNMGKDIISIVRG